MAPYQPGKMPSNHDLRDVFKLQHKPDSFTALHKCPAKISPHLLLWTRTTTTMCVGIFPHAKHSHTNLHRANIVYLYVWFRLHILCTNMRWVFTITMLLLHQCMTVCASVNLVWYFCISVLQDFAKVVTPWKRGCRLSVSCQPQVEHEVNVKVCEQQNIQNKTGAGNVGDRGW